MYAIKPVKSIGSGKFRDAVISYVARTVGSGPVKSKREAHKLHEKLGRGVRSCTEVATITN